jgi:hypothetical protein
MPPPCVTWTATRAVTGGQFHLKQLPPPAIAAGVPVAASWRSTGWTGTGFATRISEKSHACTVGPAATTV